MAAAAVTVNALTDALLASNGRLEAANSEIRDRLATLASSNGELASEAAGLRHALDASSRQFATADLDRRQLIEVLDLLPDAVLLVDADGDAIRRNAGYVATFGERPEAWPQRRHGRRACAEKFSAVDRMGRRRFSVRGFPLVGGDGALILSEIPAPAG